MVCSDAGRPSSVKDVLQSIEGKEWQSERSREIEREAERDIWEAHVPHLILLTLKHEENVPLAVNHLLLHRYNLSRPLVRVRRNVRKGAWLEGGGILVLDTALDVE